MLTNQSEPVVVGIDGSSAAAKALDWAADEAERRQTTLVIAYAGQVVDRTALGVHTARDAMDQIRGYGHELLEDAVATVVESYHLTDVKTELRETSPAQLLTGLSESAAVMVVGRGDEGPAARFIFGSNTQRVAEHAHCPVVIVGTDPPLGPGRPIVVGVSDSDGGEAALRFACAEALTRSTSVLAVRSWTEVNWAVFPFLDETPLHSLRSNQQAVLDKSVEVARNDFPGLTIDGVLTEQPAYVALEAAAREAALLVIGCRRPESSHLLRLGPLSSWLLHHSACPVAIVGQPVPAATTPTQENRSLRTLSPSGAQTLL